MAEWKLVPVEPTPGMLYAMWQQREAMRGQSENKIARASYAELLAAAPQAPSGQQAEKCGRVEIKGGRVVSYAFEQTDIPDGEYVLRALAGHQSERPAPASLNQQVRESVLLSGAPAWQAVGGNSWTKEPEIGNEGELQSQVRAIRENPNGTLHLIRRLQSTSAERLEAVAQVIYEQWSHQPDYKPWTPCGNSLKQDEARDIARATLAASQAERPAVKEDGK